MADTQNATAQNATTQTGAPQIVNNTMLYAVLSTIKILKLLNKTTNPLAPDPVLMITVDDNMVYTSKKLKKKIIPVLEIESICPSRNVVTGKQHILGVYQGKILDLIGKDVKCELRNGTEVVTGLALTFFSSSVDDIIKKIETSTSGLDHNHIKTVSGFVDTGSSLVVPLGQALDVIAKLTKKLSNVHPILSISYSVLLSVYQSISSILSSEVIKAQTKQDENVQKLVEALKDMLSACQNCHNLPEFSKPGNTIEKIGSLKLRKTFNYKLLLGFEILWKQRNKSNSEKMFRNGFLHQTLQNFLIKLMKSIFQKVDSFLWISGKCSGKTVLR
ncbi:hypothetical protein BDQ12DRAFT_668025 [Crucibulum laeve]|uniref:Uncharacterized protein n=1 Tax=Crucibulum laeve TaxID=68775 RepID=A0A5C3LSH7_9AGAR|nr:hypothetical protein BDQ12DRAFT_668025 [Crucibulum laeve]